MAYVVMIWFRQSVGFAPASSIRVITVASNSGVYPSSNLLPFIIGTPATGMQSLMASVFPASLPPSAPGMSHRQYLRYVECINRLSIKKTYTK